MINLLTEFNWECTPLAMKIHESEGRAPPCRPKASGGVSACPRSARSRCAKVVDGAPRSERAVTLFVASPKLGGTPEGAGDLVGEVREVAVFALMCTAVDVHNVFILLFAHRTVCSRARAADARVLLSRYTGLNVLGETIVPERPVIVTRAGGTREALEDSRSGFSFQAGVVRGLAQAMIALIHNHNLHMNMGVRGGQAVGSRFTWERTGKAMLALYREVLCEA